HWGSPRREDSPVATGEQRVPGVKFADAAEMVRRQGGASRPGLFAATGPAGSKRIRSLFP
ncbi:MAG: hypothetical protein V3U41_09165, partial [candidate division NC10 bacterium]